MVEEAPKGTSSAALPIDSKDLASLLPWWKRPRWVTGITSIIAATVPVTTGVWGLVQKDKEVALQESKQKHDAAMEELKLRHAIQSDFLDRLKSDTERLRTLRMVAATSEDPKFAKWASDEQGAVDADAKELQKRIDEQTKKTNETLKALSDALDSNKAQGSEIDRLTAEAQRQQDGLNRLRGVQQVGETGQAVVITPLASRAHHEGVNHLIAGEFGAAFQSFQAAEASSPSYGLAWEMMGILKPFRDGHAPGADEKRKVFSAALAHFERYMPGSELQRLRDALAAVH